MSKTAFSNNPQILIKAGSFHYNSALIRPYSYLSPKIARKLTMIGLHIIMFQNHNQDKLPKMMNFSSNCEQGELFYDYGHKDYLNNLSYEQDPIDLFLNEEVFFQKSQPIKEIQSSAELSNTHDLYTLPKPSQIKETHQHSKKKSIFHNFQKHLITLIKKSINLSQNVQANGVNDLASQLWTAFMKTRLFNKKILHMVFGVLQNSKSHEEFRKLSQQFPEFTPIYNQNVLPEIVQAQQLIRERFVEHALRQKKEDVMADSNVSRFEEFYEYYQSFVCELRSGPMTKRMTKTRKSGVVQRLERKMTVL